MRVRRDLTGYSPISRTLHRWFIPIVIMDVIMFSLIAVLAGIIPITYAYESPKMDVQASNIQEDALANYHKSLLNERETEIYDSVEKAFRSYNYVVDVPDGTTKDEAARSIEAVLFDHPDIFWGKTSYRYHYELWGLANITLTYIYDDIEQIKEMKERYDSIADEILKQAYSQPYDKVSDEDVARYIYTWIIDNTQYKGSDSTDQHISSVFDAHESVCAGYSKTMKFLCDKAGIPCLYVTGGAYDISQDGIYASHAWNVLELDGKTCYIDATWGDTDTYESDPTVNWYWFDTDYKAFKVKHLSDTSEYLDRPLWADGARLEDPNPYLADTAKKIKVIEKSIQIDTFLKENGLDDTMGNRLVAAYAMAMAADDLNDVDSRDKAVVEATGEVVEMSSDVVMGAVGNMAEN